LSGYTPGKGFSIYGKTEPVPAGDAVDTAVQILGIAITFADWRPSPEQRTTLANFLTTEAVGDRPERIAPPINRGRPPRGGPLLSEAAH
jgi:hypothetical protein